MGAEFIVSDLAGSCVEISEWIKRKNLGIKVVIRFNGSEVVFRVLPLVVLLVGYEERECKSIISLLGERKKLDKKLMPSS